MSISLDKCLIKHSCKLPEVYKTFIENQNHLTNGTYYLVPIVSTVHYKTLVTKDYDFYTKYIEAVNDSESHNETKFRSLLDSFDLEKLQPVQANLYDHDTNLWVQDGNHRLAIFLYKKLFKKNKLPMKYINVTVFESAQLLFKNALKKTVGYNHYNGWNNRLEHGYHSFDIYDMHIQGQRNPLKRFEKIKQFYDFTDKKVLDLGCNTGGMLFHISEIEKGIGLDYDQNCIDSCNLFSKRLCLGCEFEFFKQDLNTFDYLSFCKTNVFQPDIVFLLSIGSWVKEWKKLYTDVYTSGATILLETNNDAEGAPQLELFRGLDASIQLVSDRSDDDCTGNLGRKTYLIMKKAVNELVIMNEVNKSNQKKPLKLVQYPDDCHKKNRESMIRMCKACNITYEVTNDRNRLAKEDYTHLWLPMGWIIPDTLPSSIKILYGPHHFIFPESSPIRGRPNLDWSKRCIYTTLSNWNYKVFREFAPASETVIPIAPLPFGINSEIEDVKSYPKTIDCFVYFKRRDPTQLKYALDMLNTFGLSYKLFTYGSYKNEEFMNTLKTVKFGLWIGSHESQGFAFQECLASNVPILVWDATTMMDEHGSYKDYVGKKKLFATTATAWSSQCGERILQDYELPAALENIQLNLNTYKPREYILNIMNDTVCMRRILDCFNN